MPTDPPPTDPWANSPGVDPWPTVWSAIGAWCPNAPAYDYIRAAVERALAAERQQATAQQERLEQQARDIGEWLREAGVSAMPIPEGVRTILQRAEQAEAEVASLTQRLDQVTAQLAEKEGYFARAVDHAEHMTDQRDLLEVEVASLTQQVTAAAAELTRWQICENCGERLSAPGICDKAVSEHEKGLELMHEQTLDRAEEAEAHVTAQDTEIARLKAERDAAMESGQDYGKHWCERATRAEVTNIELRQQLAAITAERDHHIHTIHILESDLAEIHSNLYAAQAAIDAGLRVGK